MCGILSLIVVDSFCISAVGSFFAFIPAPFPGHRLVHLGCSITISEVKLAYTTKCQGDLKVTRNLARPFCTASEMKLRLPDGAALSADD